MEELCNFRDIEICELAKYMAADIKEYNNPASLIRLSNNHEEECARSY